MKSVVINFLGRNNAGPLIAFEIAKGFCKNGWKVYAVLSETICNRDEWDANQDIDKCYVTTYHNKVSAITGTIKFVFIDRNKIKEHFKGIKIDLVIKPMFHIWAEMVDKFFIESKIITICHDVTPHQGESRLKKLLYKKHIKSSDYVAILTKSFKENVVSNYGIKEENVIYLPCASLSRYKQVQSKEKKINYLENKFNFLFFGRIQQYKGLNTLAEAYEKIRNKRDDVTLTIVGNGDFSSYKDKYSKLLDVRIYNEFIPDNEVGCYFDGPNIITVLPYLNATQSGIIPLSFEYRDVVIASDTGGLKEQLDDGEIGTLFIAGNSDDLAEKMNYVIENIGVRKKQIYLMGKYLEDRSWDRVTDLMINNISI